MASNCYLLGDLLLDHGDPEGALQYFDSGLAQVTREFPGPVNAVLVTLRINGNLGTARAQARLFMLRPALEHYASGVKLAREWAQKDPGDPDRQWRFLRANDEAADFLGLVHAPEPALTCYENGLETCVAMLNAGLKSAELLRYVQHCYEQQAILFEVVGDAHASRVASDRAASILPPGNSSSVG
jgi:hypothetical protein